MPPRPRATRFSGPTFGGRVPPLVGTLIALTALLSIVAKLGMHFGQPWSVLGVLVPAAVWQGQVWRVFTWVFFELDHPFSLLFACLMLYWFGRDLYRSWGPRRFLALYLGFAVVVGAATCLLALAFPSLREFPYYGTWPIAEALVIAWATLYPDRQILAYFVMPIGGRSLVYLTLGGTVLFAIFDGLTPFVPHFLAEGLMLAYLYAPSLRTGALKRRLATLERRSQARRPSHLRVVGREDDADADPPPPKTWLN